MDVHNKMFKAFIMEFTKSTYIMIVVSDPDIEKESIVVNVKSTSSYFE